MKRLAAVLVVVIAVGIVAALRLGTSGATAQESATSTPQPGGGNTVKYTWAGTTDAPDFPAGADWINTSAPIRMADLRGKIVLLDFWTYGCINCIHVLPDLDRLQKEFGDSLVIIGVHSAKFTDEEGQTQNIRQVVLRYEITHPVINDNQLIVWNEYNVNAWPTFMLIDPFGKVVGQLAGEGVYSQLAPIINTMTQEYGATGALNLKPLPQIQLEPALAASNTPLRFPGKVLADAAGNRLFISDSNHNRIVVVALDTYKLLDVIGTGTEGLKDGSFETAEFYRPQGLTLDGNTLYVADTENHALRAVNLDTRTVTTAAGTGEQSQTLDTSGPGPQTALNSPWDVVAYDGKVYIAMAGIHELWVYDTASGQVAPYAGNGREGLVDGALRDANLAQPSGITTDGKLLYFADPEASAIRTADLSPDGEVKTIVGTGLFDYGDVDGVGKAVRLQHALGLTIASDGYLYVADTYNNKIKRIDPKTGESVTYLGTGKPGSDDGSTPQFYEPGGISFANGKLYVADTNNHAIRVIDMAARTVSTVQFPDAAQLVGSNTASTTGTGGLASNDITPLPPQTIGAGAGKILINVTMPDGYKFNGQAPFTAVWSDNSLVQIPTDSREIRIVDPPMPVEVPATFTAGQTELQLSLTTYWCEAVNETLCFVDRANLVMPLTVLPNSDTHSITLAHALVPPTVQNTLGK